MTTTASKAIVLACAGSAATLMARKRSRSRKAAREEGPPLSDGVLDFESEGAVDPKQHSNGVCCSLGFEIEGRRRRKKDSPPALPFCFCSPSFAIKTTAAPAHARTTTLDVVDATSRVSSYQVAQAGSQGMIYRSIFLCGWCGVRTEFLSLDGDREEQQSV